MSPTIPEAIEKALDYGLLESLHASTYISVRLKQPLGPKEISQANAHFISLKTYRALADNAWASVRDARVAS